MGYNLGRFVMAQERNWRYLRGGNQGETRIASRVHAPEQTDHCRMRLFLSIGHQFTDLLQTFR